jgi:hypothetical protein
MVINYTFLQHMKGEKRQRNNKERMKEKEVLKGNKVKCRKRDMLD